MVLEITSCGADTSINRKMTAIGRECMHSAMDVECYQGSRHLRAVRVVH